MSDPACIPMNKYPLREYICLRDKLFDLFAIFQQIKVHRIKFMEGIFTSWLDIT